MFLSWTFFILLRRLKFNISTNAHTDECTSLNSENCITKILENTSPASKNLVSRTKHISNFHKKACIYYLLLQFMQNTCVSPADVQQTQLYVTKSNQTIPE